MILHSHIQGQFRACNQPKHPCFGLGGKTGLSEVPRDQSIVYSLPSATEDLQLQQTSITPLRFKAGKITDGWEEDLLYLCLVVAKL